MDDPEAVKALIARVEAMEGKHKRDDIMKLILQARQKGIKVKNIGLAADKSSDSVPGGSSSSSGGSSEPER